MTYEDWLDRYHIPHAKKKKKRKGGKNAGRKKQNKSADYDE